MEKVKACVSSPPSYDPISPTAPTTSKINTHFSGRHSRPESYLPTLFSSEDLHFPEYFQLGLTFKHLAHTSTYALDDFTNFWN